MATQIDRQAVYAYLAAIPPQRVVTYGQIAEFLGNKNLCRAVGNILHQNPDADRYPCYKVVNAQGRLSPSYAFGGLEGQKARLETDGIPVIGNRVDLNIYQADPLEFL